mgnify:CR=1 FL=1
MKTESKIQQEIVMWYRNNFCLKHHNPRHAIFSVPNERKDKFETFKLKGTGLMSGVSDLIIVEPDRVVFVEVKTETGGQSERQQDFESIITAMGYKYLLVRSKEDFIKQLAD